MFNHLTKVIQTEDQFMENINKEKLLQILSEYNLLSSDVQARANKKILTDWRTALNSFKQQTILSLK